MQAGRGSIISKPLCCMVSEISVMEVVDSRGKIRDKRDDITYE